MTPGRRASLLFGAGLAAALDLACTQLNPAFFLDDTAAGGSGGGEGITDVPEDATTAPVDPTTGEPGGSATATGLDTGGSTGLEDTTEALASTTEDLPATTTEGTTGETSTGEPELQVLELPADAATCVLLPNLVFPFFAGPMDCESRVELISAYTGGVLVDTSFNDAGNGRPARVYLRFPIPAELTGATLMSATLELHIADFAGAGSTATGVLATTQPFLPADLAQFAPGAVDGLQQPLGPTADGETLLREIPTELLVPGQALHLGIFPTSDDGAVLAGNSADEPLRPTLTLTYY